MINKINRFIIFGIIFLIPIFFLSGVQDQIELPKQTLFVIATAISFLLWLSEAIKNEKFSCFKSLTNWLLLILFFAAIASAFFAHDKYGAFLGWSPQISSSLANFAFLCFFVFLAANVLDGYSDVKKASKIYLSSVFLAVLIGILNIFQVYLLPFDFARTISFNTVGSSNGLGLLAGSGIVLALGLLLGLSKEDFLRSKLPLIIAAAVFLFYDLLIGFKPVWYSLGIAILAVYGVSLIFGRRFKTSEFFIFALLIVISAVFSLTTFAVFQGLTKPYEISINQKASWNIAYNTLRENPAFGAGLGSFGYQFLKFKPATLNIELGGNFWSVRFGKAVSEFFSNLTMFGLVGTALLLGTFGLVLFLTVRRFIKERGVNPLIAQDSEEIADLKFFHISLAGVLIYFLVAYFFYSFATTLWFSVFLMVALLIVANRAYNPMAQGIAPSKMEVQFENSPKLAVAVALAFLVVIVFNLFSIYTVARRFAAEIYYNKAVAATNSDQIEQNLKKASDLNPYFDSYWRDLSSYSFNRFIEFANQPASNEGKQKMTAYLDSSLNYITKARNVNSESSYVWSLRGSIYRNLIGVADGADKHSIESLKTALVLDPSNPYLYTELGRAYQTQLGFVISSTQVTLEQKRQLAQTALEQYEKAIQLKPDYAPALFQAAVIWDLLGEQQPAIQRLEATKLIMPNDIGIAFQLGVLYYKTKQLAPALAEFERAVALDRNFSNARYFAGIINDYLGNRQKAIEHFTEVDKLNPGNEIVRIILSNLTSNKPALGTGAIAGETYLPIEDSSIKVPGQR